jgi:hypothetical protein
MRLISFRWMSIQNICAFIKIWQPDCRGYCILRLPLPTRSLKLGEVRFVAKNISLRCKENESWSHTYCIMHWSGH